MQGPQSVLQFDGNGYVEIQDPFATDTDFTISLWVKPAAVDTGGYHGLLGKEGDWRRKPGLWLAPAQGGLAYDSYSPAPAGKRFAETLDEFFDASRWIHLAWVKEGTAYRFYRDGELLASREAPVRVYKKKSSYWIGRVDNFWHGQIAEVSFWSTARSEEEIQAGMHAAPSGEEPLLSGYWPLDEGEGEVANDRSSNANQGTIIGATWAQAELPAPPAVPEPTPPAEPEPVKVPPAKAEPAVSDDNLEPVVELAEGQYLEIQDPFENDVDFTLSLWVKPTDIDQVSWRGLVGQHGETHPKPSLGLAPGGGRLIYACCNRTGRHYSATLNDFFVEDEWVHLAWVKNGARFEIYRNGALFFTTRNAPQRFYKKKGTYWIGKVETSWRGQIAEMRLWKTARSPEQIRADVNHRLQGDEPDLAGYWPLDEGSGDVAHDKSANANHATLHGATWQRVPFPKAADPIAWPAASKVVSSSGLSEDDRSLIDKVEVALEDGLELFHWWQKTQREGSYAERFKILDPLARSKARFGFLDQATVAGRSVPVMGTVQELLYARPQMPPAVGDEGKAEHAEYMRAQIQEFMLRYFMRVANHHSPQFDPAKSLKTPPKWLRPFSWAVGGPADRRDWGYKQVYYKRTDGETGKFSESEQRTIVDVRELGESYEWIVLEVKLFDFALTFPPFTDHLPTMSVPARSTVHVVMSRDFVMDQTAAVGGSLGRYGWGYAVIRPDTEGRALGYGPDALGPAFAACHFDVHDDGQAHLFNAFVSNQPTQLVEVSLNPIDWGVAAADFASLAVLKPVLEPLQRFSHALPFGRARMRPVFNFIALSNLLTGGLAKRELAISKEQLLKEVMAVHALDTYHFALGTLETWNQVRDWADENQLPSWIVAGRSA